jgi:hypothetical protein
LPDTHFILKPNFQRCARRQIRGGLRHTVAKVF